MDAGGVRGPRCTEPRLEAPRPPRAVRASKCRRWKARHHALLEQLPEPLEPPEGEAGRAGGHQNTRRGQWERTADCGQHGPPRRTRAADRAVQAAGSRPGLPEWLRRQCRTHLADCGGRGSASRFHVGGKITIELGTFPKALGVVGGYVAGSNDLRNYALNKSRTWLLSGSHPPAVTAACIAAIDVLETEPRHVKKLWSNTKYFKSRLVSMGFDIGRSETPITPVMLGDSATAKRFSERLFEEGVFALPIVYPMVPKDRARIRNIVNAGLRREDLDEALAAYEKIGKELRVIS